MQAVINNEMGFIVKLTIKHHSVTGKGLNLSPLATREASANE